jgi:hypothetical protein
VLRGEEWQLVDNKRNTFNPSNTALFPSATDVEMIAVIIGLIFYLMVLNADQLVLVNNASGATYIYMAFAENPFVTSTSIPTTAR